MRPVPFIGLFTFTVTTFASAEASSPGSHLSELLRPADSRPEPFAMGKDFAKPRAAETSQHRDGESGAVILELGDDGVVPLRCHGHTFFVRNGAPSLATSEPSKGPAREESGK
jgi:hypothetical protein